MNTPAYAIKTERLLIRCYNPGDAPLLKHAIDTSLEHLKTWLPWTENEPEDLEKKIQRLRENRANFDQDINYVYGIFLPDQSKLIGSIALMKRIGDHALEIGYWLHKDYINKGFATEATKALVRVGFEIAKAERIEIHCNPDNIESANIPRKLGFTHEATHRTNEQDHSGNRKKSMIWVLFQDEYQSSPIKDFSLEAFDVINEKII